jgi:ATP-dependent RNA helicase RhlE
VAETITHRVHPVDGSRKRDLLLHLLAQDSRLQTLVFARTKHGSDKLATFLEKSGIKTAAIHGNKSQGARQRALSDFKAGRINVLVATDIAARGIDIDQLPQVINFDLPMVAEDYVHRIGRTGRAGASGEAISLVAQDESGLLRAIQRVLKADITVVEVEGYTPTKTLRMGNDNPARGRPAGNRPPPRREGAPRGRRPHAGGGGERHAHAGPKGHGPRGGGERRQGTTDSAR